MSSSEIDHYLAVAVRVSKTAGSMIADGFRVSSKAYDAKESFRDLVTQTDKDVEKRVFEELKREFPNHHFIGEESASAGGGGGGAILSDDPTWIVDPIDGTCNFVHRIPHVCISIALVVEKQTILGVVFDPLANELYRAVRGSGAFCDDIRIFSAASGRLADALVICDVWASSDPKKAECTIVNMENLVGKVRGFRSFGSGVLNMCFVARGLADVYLEYGIHCWDMAAASLIVREAGGVVVDPTGGQFDLMRRRILCASSRAIVDQLLPNLSHVEFQSEGKYV